MRKAIEKEKGHTFRCVPFSKLSDSFTKIQTFDQPLLFGWAMSGISYSIHAETV